MPAHPPLLVFARSRAKFAEERPLTIIVDTSDCLAEMARQLRTANAIGVDTESDSFHSYREKICLVQVSTADEDYVVDPLALPRLAPLEETFADPAVVKVFHAAENDVAALRRDFAFDTHGIFDTMAAARILGLPRFGLGDLLREHFNVESDKRLQKFEWGRRPLPSRALDYAATDSRHLLPLRQILLRSLREADRIEEAEDEFQRLESATSRERAFDPEGWRRVKGAHALGPSQRGVLRELYRWRDDQAARLDRPPFRVAPDAALIAVAAQQPSDPAELKKVVGLPGSIAERHTSALLGLVQAGLNAPAPPALRGPRRDEAIEARFEALRTWRRARAAERAVAPDVIVPNAVLRSVAEARPKTLEDLESLGLVGPWKLSAYGAELISVAGAEPEPLLDS
jgi:ribonuclease D